MKKFILIIVAVFFLAVTTDSTLAMHCGKGLVSEGDHKYELLATCGQPVSREIVGIDNKHVGEYRIVEEWLYVIEQYGHKQMYLMKFDGSGYVREIKWLGEKK